MKKTPIVDMGLEQYAAQAEILATNPEYAADHASHALDAIEALAALAREKAEKIDRAQLIFRAHDLISREDLSALTSSAAGELMLAAGSGWLAEPIGSKKWRIGYQLSARVVFCLEALMRANVDSGFLRDCEDVFLCETQAMLNDIEAAKKAK